LANRRPQFVRLVLQLADPLRLDGEIPTDFRDLAFDNFRGFGRHLSA